MKQYHYSDGTHSYGPFNLEELKAKPIHPDTLIWTEDLVTWTKAREIPELQHLLTNTYTAPPLPEFKSAQTFDSNPPLSNDPLQRPPKTYLLESILTTIFCCWPLGIPSIIYASRVEKKFYAGDHRGAEEDSANARKWMIINLVACVALWIIYLAFFGIAFLGAFTNGF